MMRTITLEEHFVTDSYMAGRQLRTPPHLVDQLRDLGDRRIEEMDAAGIDTQVLSLNSPGVEQLDASEAQSVARATNDELAEAVKRYPTRFAGLAALPTMSPDVAADELSRIVSEYGFVGAVINGHTRGRYLDDPFFWPILERAQSLHVPIYLHPTLPPQAVLEASYTGNFSREVSTMFALAGWGWHIETAIHMLRVVLSGAFDKYPNLQFIIGHMGEALPFMLTRIGNVLNPQLTKLARPTEAYLRENVHYTFSGFNFAPTFADLLAQIGVDRIMFSVDYPYGSMAESRTFLDQLPVSDTDRERIAHGNAEQLLKFT